MGSTIAIIRTLGAQEEESRTVHALYIYIFFFSFLFFFSPLLFSCLPRSLWLFVLLLFLSLAARTGFLGTRCKGGVTSDVPRKFISRFNAAALLALIYIHSPKPRTTSGARLVSSLDRPRLTTGLPRKSSSTGRRVAAASRSLADEVNKNRWSVPEVLLGALIFFISGYELQARRIATSDGNRRDRETNERKREAVFQQPKELMYISTKTSSTGNECDREGLNHFLAARRPQFTMLSVVLRLSASIRSDCFLH